MKAYLIDPEARTMAPVEHDGSLASIYKHTACNLVDVVRVQGDNAIYVDDEGLLKPGLACFQFGEWTLAGRGLIVGTDDEGNDAEPTRPFEYFAGRLSWLVRPGGAAVRTGELGAPEPSVTVTSWPVEG